MNFQSSPIKQADENDEKARENAMEDESSDSDFYCQDEIPATLQRPVITAGKPMLCTAWTRSRGW